MQTRALTVIGVMGGLIGVAGALLGGDWLAAFWALGSSLWAFLAYHLDWKRRNGLWR